jgi:DNA-binding transcriptional LysR family regulator
VKLSALNLNLLLVLHTVLETGSVGAAAARLHVTQSAVSNALARLRVALSDPLVVRRGRGLAPTPVAVSLAPHLEAAMRALGHVLERQRPFDPATSTRCFTLVDSEELSDFPRLVQLFEQRLPRAVLEMIDEPVESALAAGRADVALGRLDGVGAGLHREPLYEVESVLLVRRDHPLLRRRPRRHAEWARLPRVEMRVGKRRHVGLAPEVAVVVPSFMAAALAVVRSNYAAEVPRGFAEAVARVLPLAVVASPAVASETVRIALIWHERTHEDEAARFFRRLVLDALRPGRARDPIRTRARRAGARRS